MKVCDWDFAVGRCRYSGSGAPEAGFESSPHYYLWHNASDNFDHTLNNPATNIIHISQPPNSHPHFLASSLFIRPRFPPEQGFFHFRLHDITTLINFDAHKISKNGYTSTCRHLYVSRRGRTHCLGRTLTDDEVNAVMDNILSELKEKLNAELR